MGDRARGWIVNRIGPALLAACVLGLGSAAPALAADRAAPPALVEVPDRGQIDRSGDEAVAAARSLNDQATESYLNLNSAAQEALRTRLAENAAQIAIVSDEVLSVQGQIAENDRRIGIEQEQLRMLARVIYQEPESPLVAIGGARTLSEALTRAGDLFSVGSRALRTKRTLQLDLARGTAQRARLQSELARQQDLAGRLESDFQSLRRYAGEVTQTQAEVRQAQQQEQEREQLRAIEAVIPRAAGPTQLRMQEVIRQTWAPLGPEAVVWAERIAFCESTYNPYSVNRSSGASGLFQFLPSTWAGTPYAAQSPFDPVANSAAAAWLYQRYGPRQWECRG